MNAEPQPEPVPFVHIDQGDSSAARVVFEVKHDLGDRTLVVVILLALVIGVCTYVIGRNMARQDSIEMLARDVAAKTQVTNNQNARIEAELKARKP